MKRTLSLLLCLVLLVAVFAACGGGTEPSQAPETSTTPTPDAQIGDTEVHANEGDTLYERKTDPDSVVIAVDQEPDNLDPAECQLVHAWALTSAIYDNLITMDPETGEYVNQLAESIEYTDDLTLEIKIKSGIQFSNGTPLTAEDVMYTFEHMANSSRFSSNFACIDFENSTVNDETSLTVKMLNPYAPFLAYVAHPACGIISKAYVEEVGEDTFARNPMGTGPFTFVKWDSGDRVELTRNDNYWGELPAYKTVVMRFITEPTTRMIEFETGGVDIATNLANSDIERMKNGEVSNATLYTIVSENINRIGLLDTFEPFQDYNVRIALAHAIDMQTVVDVAFGAEGLATGNVYPSDCKYYEEFPLYEYDPELAKQMLADAGYAEGLTLTGGAIAGSADAKAMEIIQNMLKEVGVTLNFETVDVGTLINKSLNGEYNFAPVNATNTSRDPDQAVSNIKASSPFKLTATADPTLNEYFDIGATVVDEAQREEAYQAAAQYMYDNAITIPMCTTVFGDAVRDYVDFYPAYASHIIDLRAITFK